MSKFQRIIFLLFFVSILMTYHNSIAVTKDKVNTFHHTSINTCMLHTLAPRLSNESLTVAVNAYQHAEKLGQLKKNILTIVDYSLPSSQKRLWVFDISQKKILFNTYVAHGKNSGDLYSTHFSNIPQSKESSIGAYLTQNTYFGSKGLSLNLKGLEKGYNTNAFSRRIVMHGAWYMEDDFIKRHGRAGRSWGCPAVNPMIIKPIVNTIKDGSLLLAYYPDKHYLIDNHVSYHA